MSNDATESGNAAGKPDAVANEQLEDETMICAACGKTGGSPKRCTACKLVRYCNSGCQRAHRRAHKKACRERAAELAAEKEREELAALDAWTPPPREECPVCTLAMPLNPSQSVYKSCCGNLLCASCVFESNRVLGGAQYSCPFCRRVAAKTDREEVGRLRTLIARGDPKAMLMLSGRFVKGESVSNVEGEAIELLRRAADLGQPQAARQLGKMYSVGLDGVERDVEEAERLLTVAAERGFVAARWDLGELELGRRNFPRAKRHLIIAAAGGNEESLERLKQGYRQGFVEKSELEKALRAAQEAQVELTDESRRKHRESLRILTDTTSRVSTEQQDAAFEARSRSGWHM